MASTLSKKAQKRLLQSEAWKLKKKLKKKNKPLSIPKEIDMTAEAVLFRKEKQSAKRETFMMRVNEGLQIAIDCDFEEEMTEREINSLSQQLMYVYGVNRKSPCPASLCFAGVKKGGVLDEKLNKNTGFKHWQAISVQEKGYNSMFDKKAIVYLTADSENTINTLEKDMVYVIGGIVDRNRLKDATFKRAQKDDVATARLPLQEHVDMAAMTRVLTVNHVYEILLKYEECKNWKDALLAVMPRRKHAVAKDGEH